MQEIKPDQRWREGLNEVQVMTASRVRVVIRPNGTNDDEEITFASGLRSLRIGECVQRPGWSPDSIFAGRPA